MHGEQAETARGADGQPHAARCAAALAPVR